VQKELTTSFDIQERARIKRIESSLYFCVCTSLFCCGGRRCPQSFLALTSRCPYCAFGFHCKVRGMDSVSAHLCHVNSCHSCKFMSIIAFHDILCQFLVIYVIYVISFHVHSCQFTSFMSLFSFNDRVNSCYSSKVLLFKSFISIHVIRVNSYQFMSFMSIHIIRVNSCNSCQFLSIHVIDVNS
jgi:hypothetical protein